MTTEINIDDYLSESEKKELAIDAFKKHVTKSLFKFNDGVKADSETQRIIGNISYQIVYNIMEAQIPNFENLIVEKCKSIISSQSDCGLFEKKNLWEEDEGIGYKIAKKTLEENNLVVKGKVEEAISKFDYESEVRKLTSEMFAELADKLWSISNILNKE